MQNKEIEEALKSMKRFANCRQDMEAVTAYEMKIVLEHIDQLENKVKELEKQRNELATILSDEEDKKQEWKELCNECSELAKAANWTKEDTNRVITEYRKMEAKANKYDSLVEKIKKDIEEYPEATYTKYYLLDRLELLDTEKQIRREV